MGPKAAYDGSYEILLCFQSGNWISVSLPRRVGGLQIQRTLAEVDAVRADVNPLHEQLHDARLLGWEELVSDGIEPLQRRGNF